MGVGQEGEVDGGSSGAGPLTADGASFTRVQMVVVLPVPGMPTIRV